uniref:NAD(P)H dehydrogenase (quinone) n=1 Tax=Dunaliella tertiolecta TaxID=3047 RepID=A0A7S3QL93_DUNTE|mmetsp:Transcript_14123/g.38193  ORF Transcript_14123/g.38193 Transcript_14123/m.38193 type:complete len:219 (+) Transcript_14123:124-780(+)
MFDCCTKEPDVKEPSRMTAKVFIVYYSTYGHVRQLAVAMKQGIDSVEGVEGVLYQCPETLPKEVLEKMHAPPKPSDPVINIEDLPKADGFAFGTPTRFGGPSAQMKAMWDATGSHWSSGALQCKPFTLFTSTASQNGGQESTMLMMLSNMVHHGMIYVPPGYITPATNFDLTEVHGGSAWGPGCLAAGDGSRQPSEKELAFAKDTGAKLAKITLKLKA